MSIWLKRIAVILALLPSMLLLGSKDALAHRRGVVIRGGVVIGAPFVYWEPFYWDPFWYPGYAYYGPPGYVYAPPRPPRNWAPVEVDVKPRKTEVRVDGEIVGQARDYNSRAYPLWLKVGTHDLEFAYPGHKTLKVKIEVKKGRAYHIRYDLQEGEGTDPRST